MSVSSERVRHLRAIDLLVATAILVSGACHRAPSSAPRPSTKEEQEVRRFAGVDIVRTAGPGFLVRIHSGSVGEAEPLYVIDGAPMKISATRGIDWFKPEDIVEMKVLKYPYELAEYGANGANGVIVITTRQNPSRKR